MFKQLMVMAPAGEDDQPGGGVNESDAPADDTNPSPDVEESPDEQDQPPAPRQSADPDQDDDAEPPSPQRDRQEQQRQGGIPHARVRQMVAAARIQAQRELQAQLQPLISRLDPERMRQEIATSMLRGMGVEPKKPAPKYLTQEDVDRRLEEHRQQLEELRQEDLRQRQIENDTALASRDMERAKIEHAAYFDAYPDLEDDIANTWGSRWAVERGLTVKQIADMKIRSLRSALGKLNKSLVDQEQERQVVTPVRPGGSPRPSAPRNGTDVSTDEGAKREALRILRQG